MTKRNPIAKRARATPTGPSVRAVPWMLHEAKARFSELVRLANTTGPQRVTVHGRDQVVVLSAEDYERLKGEQSGRVLVDLLRDSPLKDVEFGTGGVRSPVRDVQV